MNEVPVIVQTSNISCNKLYLMCHTNRKSTGHPKCDFPTKYEIGAIQLQTENEEKKRF